MTGSTIDIEAVLENTFLRVAESLTFMFGEPAARDELDLAGRRFYKSEMGISGDIEGRLSVALSENASREIAANILGLEPEDEQSRSMTQDALGEMLNVIAGQVVRDIAGEDAYFALHPPVTAPIEWADLDSALEEEGFAGFILDGHPGLFGLQLNN